MMTFYQKNRSWGLATLVAVLFMFAAPAQSQTNCQMYIDLYDSWGDGWNGCSIDVKVNNVVVLNDITLGSGSGPGRFSFTADVNDVITTTFTAVSWPEECSYKILDGNNNVLVSSGPQSGGPPNISYTVTSSACVSAPAPPDCQYTIRMWDDFGDGWNGGYLKVYLDGQLAYNNITLNSGSGPSDAAIGVYNGDSISVQFVAGGWAYECEFKIYDKDMREIYSDGLNGTTPSTSLKYVGKAACFYDLAVKKAVLGYAENYWARREAPDNNVVHATLEDVLDVSPPRVKAVYKIGSMPADSTDGVAESFDLTWGGPLTEITFQTPINTLATGPSPIVYVKVFHPEDNDNSNDGMAANSEMVFNEDVKGFEDFQSWEFPLIGTSLVNDMGWSVADLDGGDTWQTFNYLGQMLLYHPGPATSDWVFTPSALLDAAGSYRLQGDIVASAPNTTIELAFGTSPDPASMTVFATFSNFTVPFPGPTSFAMLAGGYAPYFNTPPTSPDDYYIGIHIKSGGIAIDWIKLDKNPSPPPVIGFGQPGADISTFVDDAGASIDLTAIYKQPGKITKTYEVASTTDIYGLNGDFLWDVETTDSWISITKETPDPTLQGYNFAPPRPRQHQTFTMTVDPAGLAPGLHTGTLRFYGTLFNDDFPPPDQGLIATNEIYEVKVNLRIITAGTKSGPSQLTATLPGPFTVAGSPYDFVDQSTGMSLATVEVTNGQINTLTIHCFPNQLPQNLARKMYVTRYWQIDYTGTGWTANVTFPYADQEAGMVMDKSQLRGIRQPTPNGQWEDPIMGTTSVSDPGANTVTVSNLNEFNVEGSIALAHPYMIVVKDGRDIPQSFGLEQNYPNPFNPTTSIAFNVAEERHVRLAVYNSLGAEVAVLVDEVLAAGRYTRTFDATGLPSGTYVYRLMAGDYVQTERMTLSK